MWDSFELDKRDGIAIVGARWLGVAVRRRRHRLGLSQRRLANLSGIDQSVISRLENGRLKGIRHLRLLKLIGTLGGLDEDSPLPWFENPQPLPYVSLIGDVDDDEGEGDADDEDVDDDEEDEEDDLVELDADR